MKNKHKKTQVRQYMDAEHNSKWTKTWQHELPQRHWHGGHLEDFVVVESSFPNPGNLNGINNFMETDDPLIHNDDNIICETMSCISLYRNLGMAVS